MYTMKYKNMYTMKNKNMYTMKYKNKNDVYNEVQKHEYEVHKHVMKYKTCIQ